MAVQPGLCRTWSETPKTGFLITRLILESLQDTTPKIDGRLFCLNEFGKFVMSGNFDIHYIHWLLTADFVVATVLAHLSFGS